MKAWMDKRDQLARWMTGGGVAGSVISFFAGFLVGTLQGLVGPHVAPISGFDLHSLKQHSDQPQMAMLPWILMFVLGYSLSQLSNRAFDCSQNPSCVPYPSGPFGGGGGGGW